MALDGITLRAICSELNEKLLGGHIQKIYQINNHLIILNIYNNKENHRLLISSNPQNARVHLTTMDYDNPTVPPQYAMILRKHLQNSTINSIGQNGLDRTLELSISSKDEMGHKQDKKLIIDIMGKHSNIVLTDSNYKVIEAIKRISHEMSSVRAVYPGTSFSLLEDDKINITDEIPELTDLSIVESYKLKKVFYMNFTGFGPQIGTEIAYRSGLDSDISYGSLSDQEKLALNDSYKEISEKIRANEFKAYLYTDKEKSIDFYPIRLSHLGDSYEELDSISKALDIYYKDNVNDNSLNQAVDNLKKQLENLLEKAQSKLINLNKDLALSKDHDTYRIQGDLLSSISYKINKGMTEIEADNFYDGSKVIIDLDPKKSAWDNIELKYKKAKKLHKSYKLLQESIPKQEDLIAYLANVIRQLSIVESLGEVEEIKEELRDLNLIKVRTGKKDKKIKQTSTYLKFRTDNNNFIYVGKNNKQNEELTLRVANPDDYFFHIKDLPGSHVILKKGQEIKDYEIDIAAYLAAKYSKNGNDRYIDVDYTQKKNVNKAKGAKPGMVYYTDFITLRVDLENEPQGYSPIED